MNVLGAIVTMAWVHLFVAGLFEVGFTTALRYVNGLSAWRPILVFVLCAAASFTCLTLALRAIPLGTAYAIWTGLGAAGTVLIGLLFYGEPADLWRVLFLTLLITSIVGLKLVSA
jgi:quaternary ammonium compound-resistance protein SugE